MKLLEDSITVVTGASGGIGRAISLALMEKSLRVYIVGRNLESLLAISEGSSESTQSIQPYQADLTSVSDIEGLAMFLHQDYGSVDVLIHCAGTFSMGPIENTHVKDFDRLYQVNLRAPFMLTQALLPMLKSVQGQVVFINSSVGLVNAKENLSQYAAVKHGLKALADSLRAEVNESGVRVISVYPGRTASPMQEKVHKFEGADYRPSRLLQPETVARVVIDALTMPRTAEMTDISIRPFMKH